jgi:hypothetical protein
MVTTSDFDSENGGSSPPEPASLRERVAKAIYLRRPDCMGKPWPFDVMTPKERRGYNHNPIAAVDLSFEYADAAIAVLTANKG